MTLDPGDEIVAACNNQGMILIFTKQCHIWVMNFDYSKPLEFTYQRLC